MMRQETIENYLKTIYNLSSGNTSVVSNSKLSEKMGLNPATVTEGVKKLHELNYVVNEKSYGTRLTAAGAKLALSIVRRHRIWETYLVKKLDFGWDEVHEIAEELEHIRNDKLISKLSSILGNPSYDPHGDPIPDAKGKIRKTDFIRLSDAKLNKRYIIMGVTEHSPPFLKQLEKQRLVIGVEMEVKEIESYDGSLTVRSGRRKISMSRKTAENIIVREE